MSNSHKSIKLLPKGQLTLVCVGLSLSWFFFAPGLFSHFFQDAGMLALSNQIILPLLIAAAVLAIVFRRWVEPFIYQHRILVFILILGNLLGYALLLVAPYTPWAFFITCSALAVLALSYFALVLAWACLLACLDRQQASIAIAVSALLYALMTTITSLPLLSGPVVSMLIPALSGACWLAIPPTQAKTFDYSFSNLKHLPFFLLGLFALFLMGGRIVVGLFFNLESDLRLEELLIRSICIAGVIIYFVRAIQRSTTSRKSVQNIWMPVVLLFLLGSLIIIVFGQTHTSLGSGITSAALNCFEILAYMALIGFVINRNASPVLVISLGFILFKVIPIALQRLVVSQFTQFFGIPEEQFMSIIMLIILAVIAGILGFFHITSSRQSLSGVSQEGTEQNSPESTFEECCKLLGTDAGLTERESDIMALIARGNSQKRISEELYLAQGTVQWYTKIIYRKLEVHSKQEVIDLINERIKDN